MKEIYLKRSEVEAKLNPKKSPKLEILAHPETIFNNNMTTYSYPQEVGDNTNEITPIIVKLILTNQEHDGIWLSAESDKDKISIPGGHMLDSEYKSPIFTIRDRIYKTLTRELLEEHRYFTSHQFDAMILDDGISFDIGFKYAIQQYRLQQVYDIGYPIMYHYYLSPDYEPGQLTIYVIREVEEPELKIPAFQNYGFGQLVWYSRMDHYYNMKYKGNRKDLFHSEYTGDIRTDDRLIHILDTIFQTKSLFGYLNIY